MPSDRQGTTTRRRYLAVLGSSTSAGLAGCGILEKEPRRGPTDVSSRTSTATETERREVSDAGSPTRETEGKPETATGNDVDPPDDTWDEGGPPDRDGWTVTFQDAFDEGSLDWDIWELGFGPGGATNCAGAGCALERNVAIEDDRLVLRTTDEDPNEPGPDGEHVPRGTYVADYSTAAITTGRTFTQTFGYFEVKSKIPAQPGGLPAFWAWPVEGNPPEIDVYEVFGAKPHTLSAGYHVDCNDNGEMIGRGGKETVDHAVDERFQVVGCEWTPDHVVWYVDGEEFHRVEGFYHEECHTPTPMHPILSTHVVGQPDNFVGPDQAGDPADADYPYTHEFEWVRVWQREEWA